jgi:hypothetical protein
MPRKEDIIPTSVFSRNILMQPKWPPYIGRCRKVNHSLNDLTKSDYKQDMNYKFLINYLSIIFGYKI